MAIGDFLRSRFVKRRRTMACRRDEYPVELETIVGIGSVWLIGEFCAVQRAVQPVSAAIAREHASGAIGTVCGRSKAKNEPGWVWVAKVWDGLSPISIILERLSFFFGDLLTPVSQARTSIAGDNLLVEGVKIHRGLFWSVWQCQFMSMN